MPRTPDRSPGALEEDEEIRLGANAVPPSVDGAVSFDGAAFQMRDALGVFNPRSGGGISEAQHEALDHFTHALNESHEQIPVFNADGVITSVTAQGVDGGTVIRDMDNLTADADGLITGARTRHRNAAGVVVETLTAVVTNTASVPAKNVVTKS